jgi:hypothetical protein
VISTIPDTLNASGSAGPAAQTWESLHGTHENLLTAFWRGIGFELGDFMTVGMALKRGAWLERVRGRTTLYKIPVV